MKSKLLIVTDTVTISGLKSNRDPSEFNGTRTTLKPGVLIFCVDLLEGNVRNSFGKIHQRIPAVRLLYQEGLWESVPDYFAVARSSKMLEGRSFCFTGKMKHAREFYKSLVELHGGTYASGVTKGLSYLVMADENSHSTKAEMARNLHIPLLKEDEFVKQLLE